MMATRYNPPLWVLLLSFALGMALGGALFYALTAKARLVFAIIALCLVALNALASLLRVGEEKRITDRDEE